MDRKAFSIINVIRNIVSIYFDTFFAIYFFNLTNYEVLPFAKYYLIVYITLLLSFWFLSTNTRLKYKVYYYRIGISFQALYLALIMLFKEDIVNHIYLVAIMKGLSEGFYYYPRNILNSSKISNNERKKYNGTINAINNASGIIIPLLLGIFLTYYTYVEIGKVVFILMIVIFILSFYVKDNEKNTTRISLWKFYQSVKKDKVIQNAFIMQFLQGFTVGSGVLVGVMTLYKILYFKSNLYIGILNSILGLLTCITCIIYAKSKMKHFRTVSIITLVSMIICLVSLGISPSNIMFIVYLVIYAVGITLITLTCDNIIVNVSNDLKVKSYHAEYHLFIETLLEMSRILGFGLLLIIGLLNKIEYLNVILFISIIPLTLLVIYVINTKDKYVE